MPPDGYGIGLFDSKGPERFAESIGKITSALTGVQSAFNTFGSSAQKSISSITQLVDSLTKSMAGLQKQIQGVQGSMGGMGGGGGGGGAGAATAGGGSGGTGSSGSTQGLWLPGSMRGNAGGFNQGPLDTGQGTQPDGSAVASQLKDTWAKMTEGSADDAKALAGSGNKMTTSGNGGQGGGGLGGPASMISGAIGSAANVLSSSAAQNLIASAVQGQFIGASLGPSFGKMTMGQQQGAYVIPKGTFAQSAADYGQANMYMANYMGADPFGGQSVAGQNSAAFNRSAQQLMTMMPSMTRQQAMVATNQMQQPGTLNAGLMFGLNFKPGGKAMDITSQYSMIYQKLFAGFPGGAPSGDQFESYMAPGGPGENNLAALGITPGSDGYSGFMQYARARIGMKSQGKDITKVDLGTKQGAKAAGFGQTAAYAQLQAQSAKSRMESVAEPGIAGAAKNLNDAAAALLKAATPLSALGGGLIGKIFGGSGGLLGGITSKIPGMGMATGMLGHLPGVGGIIKSIFQQGGEVPGTGPQLAVVHGGEFVLTGLVADGEAEIGDHLADPFTRPAVDARHRVFREYRLAVMKLEFRAQPERPGAAVRRHLLGLDHLALGHKLVVQAVKRVPHHGRCVAHHIGTGPDRIEIGEIGLRHEAQRACCGALRDRGACKSARRCRTGRGLQECSSIHDFAPRFIDFDANSGLRQIFATGGTAPRR